MRATSGEILCLVGPNGAGKSTLLSILGGQLCPDSGQVYFRASDAGTPQDGPITSIAGLSPHRIGRLGIRRTFQTSQLFPELTVLQNIEVACNACLSTPKRVLQTLLIPWRSTESDANEITAAEDYLRAVGLWRYRNYQAKNLPFGSRRIAEVARCLAGEPSIILLDEPTAGMNQQERIVLAKLLRQVKSRGITIILVAHDMDLVRTLADRVVVLHQGRLIFDGHPDDLRNDTQVVSAYLGSTGVSNAFDH